MQLILTLLFLNYAKSLKSSEEISADFSPEIYTNETIIPCIKKSQFQPDFDSLQVFPNVPFHPLWLRQKWFWLSEDFNFEKRFRKFQSTQPRLKVYIVPHSHSDPGWLKTFESYFYSQTKHTLDLAVEKLNLYPNMTFVWNEISFLSLWWRGAKLRQKIQFLELVKEGRLEILGGMWVMADEATTSIYGLIDQLIEGRQWLLNNLGITPNVSWAIDPFGHSSSMPYILKSAGINNMVIQRLHYGWKKYLAETMQGNFNWVQRWDTENRYGIRCHNAPFDIYTTKHTCGPDPHVCLRLDFRNIPGEYSEYMRYSRPVREIDIEGLATDFVGQLQRTASLSKSNVILFPLGDDFRFDKAQEWDQQYENYVPLINHINLNYGRFGVDINFGTVGDYFEALEKTPLPKFSGDFFPYADVYVSGRPSYWTGFYGTRPYWKKFYRETEAILRSTEILYSYAFNLASDPIQLVTLKREYSNLSRARRNLALFAHHDGTTGTSRKATMDDYGRKLFDASQASQQIQRQCIRTILQRNLNISLSSLGLNHQRNEFSQLPINIPRVIYESDEFVKKIVIFNSLSFERVELVKIQVTSPYVKVRGPTEYIQSQINPVVNGDFVFQNVYELNFVAVLKPLTLHFYQIEKASHGDLNLAQVPMVSCRGCQTNAFFETFNISNQIVIGNGEQDLYFDPESGLLRRVTLLNYDVSIPIQVSFGGYKSIFRESGAYLLKPDLDSNINIPFQNETRLIVVEGTITSYLTFQSDPLQITTRVTKKIPGIHVENVVDLGTTPGEIYMRLDTWLNSTTISKNGAGRQPTMFTDQNGFTFEKRVKIPWINYEGNVYPVNTNAWIQDADNFVRFSVLTDRAHGFNSMVTGRLETLIERRTLYDDGRGMSEGVTDNRRTISNYVFLVERLGDLSGLFDTEDELDYSNNLPTLEAQHSSLSLNYPIDLYFYDDFTGSYLGELSLLSKNMPKDSHIINFKTIANLTLPLEEESPTNNALLIVQKIAHLHVNSSLFNCDRAYTVNQSVAANTSDLFEAGTRFTNLEFETADVTDLAGVLGVEFSGRRSTLPILERKGFEITTLMIGFRTRKSGIRHYYYEKA